MAKFLIFFLLTTCAFARDLDKQYEKTKITVAKKTIHVYVADDDKKREEGLMSVDKLEPDTGMIFIFEKERPLAFWMKNCRMPISVGFFNKRGVLIDVQEMVVPKTIMEMWPPSYQSRGNARFALEMEKGWFAKNHVAKGAKLTLSGPVKSPLLKSSLATDQRRD